MIAYALFPRGLEGFLIKEYIRSCMDASPGWERTRFEVPNGATPVPVITLTAHVHTYELAFAVITPIGVFGGITYTPWDEERPYHQNPKPPLTWLIERFGGVNTPDDEEYMAILVDIPISLKINKHRSRPKSD